MIIDKLNLNHLRLFECVYRTHSMTKSAQELHLTQSGVSQHMKNLEDSLGIKLFDRIKQKLIPTPPAKIFYESCKQGLWSIEHTLETLQGVQKELSGTVSIGMPIEFGTNCVIPILSQFSKTHPLLHLDIRFGYAYEMNAFILKGDLDFAFVDSFGFDRRIHTEPTYDEILLLCASQSYLKKKGSIRKEKKYFESLHYIDYLKGSPVLRMWFNHHFPKKHFALNTRSTVMDVQGVATLILSDLGAGVLPSHHILKLGTKSKSLHIFKEKTLKPLKNTIHIAYLREKSHSAATTAILGSLRFHESH